MASFTLLNSALIRIFLHSKIQKLARKNLYILMITALLSCQIYSNDDLSISPSFNPSTNQRVFLISFAHGEVYERNQNYLAYTAINKGIDTIISYRPYHIDSKFYQENKKILDLKRGSGYWLWKPYFILETLKAMSTNDILIYVDAGIFLKDTIAPILESLNSPDTNMLLFKNFHKNRRFIKRDTFDIMEVDYKYRDDQHLDAAIIAMKKTPTSCEFIEKWLQYCRIERALTDMPSENEEFKDFRTHRHDQAILSLLCKKYADPTIKLVSRRGKTAARIFHHHRRREANEPLKGLTGNNSTENK